MFCECEFTFTCTVLIKMNLILETKDLPEGIQGDRFSFSAAARKGLARSKALLRAITIRQKWLLNMSAIRLAVHSI